jgi:hypothetical protein
MRIQLSSILNRAYFRQEESLVGVKERFIYVNIDLVSHYLEVVVQLLLAVTVGSFERFCVHSADFQSLFHDFCLNNILKSKYHISYLCLWGLSWATWNGLIYQGL